MALHFCCLPPTYPLCMTFRLAFTTSIQLPYPRCSSFPRLNFFVSYVTLLLSGDSRQISTSASDLFSCFASALRKFSAFKHEITRSPLSTNSLGNLRLFLQNYFYRFDFWLPYLCFLHCLAASASTFQYTSPVTQDCTELLVPFAFSYSRLPCITLI